MVSQPTYLYNVNPHIPKTVFILRQDPEIELTLTSTSLANYQVSLQVTWTLQWHHECDAISNHQPHDCLLNPLFRRRSKKTSKLCATNLCAGNSPLPSVWSCTVAYHEQHWAKILCLGCSPPEKESLRNRTIMSNSQWCNVLHIPGCWPHTANHLPSHYQGLSHCLHKAMATWHTMATYHTMATWHNLP